MKFKTKIFLFLPVAIFFISTAKSQEDQSVIFDKNDTTILQYLKNFDKMHVGYYGSTQNCEPYEVYALKYKYHWFLFVKKDDNVSLMQIKPPVKNKEIDYPSRFFAEGLARCYALNYTRFVKKKRDVFDMDIYGYYKFTRNGRKVMKGLLLLEYPYYKQGLFSWKLDEEEAKKMVEEELAKQTESIKEKVKPVKSEILDKLPVKKEK